MPIDLSKRLKDAHLHLKAKEILSTPSIKSKKPLIKIRPVRLVPKIEKKQFVLQKGKLVLKTVKEPSMQDIRKKSPIYDARKKWIKGTKRISVIKRVTREEAVGKREWRGPYPAPLGDDLILGLELKKAFENPKAQEMAAYSMYIIYNRLYVYILDLIDRYTPEDTGLLKNSLKHSISEKYSELPKKGDKKPSLNIWLHATPDYAGIVNKMPTYGSPHVRHPPYSGYYTIGKSGKKLYDPTAIGGFYNFILMNARRRAKKILEEEFKVLASNLDTLTQIRMTSTIVKNLFRAKFR